MNSDSIFPLNSFVLSKYFKSVEAGQISGRMLKNGRYKFGWQVPGREVFIKSGIFMFILSELIEIFFNLIFDIVCILWAVTRAISVAVFLVSQARSSDSAGYLRDKKSRTIDGSHVSSYLGKGGRIL